MEAKQTCSLCRLEYEPELTKSGKPKKMCKTCRDKMKTYSKKYRCEHGNQKHHCRQCQGKEVRKRGRKRTRCSNCEHVKCSRCGVCRPLLNLKQRLAALLWCAKKTWEFSLMDATYQDLLGIPVEIFLQVIINTYGRYPYDWEIDHRKPVSRFDFRDPMEVRRCFHWTNMWMLPEIENMRKHNCWDDDDELFWQENICEKSLL